MKLTAQRPRRPNLPWDRLSRKSTDQDTAIVGADIHSDSCSGGHGELAHSGLFVPADDEERRAFLRKRVFALAGEGGVVFRHAARQSAFEPAEAA